jgi:hypothetical protein
MPAHVQTAPYLDRSARVICEDCQLDERHSRTEPAQQAAAEHNAREHAFPPPLDLPEETP